MTKKIKPVSKIRTMIDELAEINQEYKELGGRKKDLEVLIKDYFDNKDLDEAEDYLFIGNNFQLDLGPIAEKRTITDMEKVKKFLGKSAFMELATVKLSDIDKYLSEEQKGEVIKKERSGSRVMKFHELPPSSNLKKSKKRKTKEKDFDF